MDYSNFHLIWLITGLIFISIDIFFTSIVFLALLGFGAITCAIILTYVDLEIYYQFILFGISSLIWLLTFYKSLKNYLFRKQKAQVHDIIGDKVIVIDSPLQPNIVGKVKWSGVIFNSILDDDQKCIAKVGQLLVVSRIEGNVLVCSLII